MHPYRVIDFRTKPVRIKRNLRRVWVVDLLWRRVIFRSYPRHKYLMIVKPFKFTVFDWWPNDKGDRLRLFGRKVLS